MRNFILVFFTFTGILFAQIDISAGMGINFFSSSSLKDYINYNFSFDGAEMSTLNTSAEFFGEADYSVSENFQVGIEYAYMLYSYNTNSLYYSYELSTSMHKPSLVAYHVINGEGYKFKLGGGIGPRVAVWEEKIYSTNEYNAAGIGFLLKAQGHTLLSDNVYANIGVDLRYDAPGKFEENANNSIISETDFNSIIFGIKLGVSYFF